jgi:hypothetical protein
MNCKTSNAEKPTLKNQTEWYLGVEPLNPHGTKNEAEIAQALQVGGSPVGHIGRQASELQVSNHLTRKKIRTE